MTADVVSVPPAVQVIDGATALITKHGWGRGTWRNEETGCYCIDGALIEASGCDYDINIRAFHPYDKAFDAVARVTWQRYGSFVLVANDTHVADRAEALSVLADARAHLLKEAGQQ